MRGMNREREESMAAALWAYVERVREQDRAAARGLDGLTRADLEELVALFHTAAAMPAALDTPASESTGAAGERVRAAIAARSTGALPHRPHRLLGRLPGLAPAAGRWVA